MFGSTRGSYLAASLVAIGVACTRSEPQTLTLSAALVERPTPAAAEPPAAEPPAADPNSAAAAGRASACPEGMVMVEGEYCLEVEHKCLEWMDPPGTKYAQFRCARYAKPATCKGERVHKRFCIDKTERTSATVGNAGSKTPMNFVSFNSARTTCESVGARVCKESEWQFACEGEEMRPYPYGWERDATACNTDIFDHLMSKGRLADHRAEAGSHARCASPFGVMDLAGNMEEWVAADGSKFGWKQVMKGSWWIPSRHACRQFQVGHGPEYGGAETGTRCCKDAP